MKAWKALVPPLLGLCLLVVPAPAGLAPHAWHYFALFAAVIAALVLEPLPGGAVGLLGLTVAVLFARFLLYSPEQLAKPGFSVSGAALAWGLSGFSNPTVWLIFAAFMFALAYEKTGLGRRIALVLVKLMGSSTLYLGYAVLLADLLLAPFTPSNTARSGGTIFPVISHLPPLYDSKPNDPSRHRIGSYLMWVALATTCVTSSLFMTALAPNVLAVELVRKTIHVDLQWLKWLFAALPACLLLLALIPLVTYWVEKPSVKGGPEVPRWAAEELAKMGVLTRKEVLLLVYVGCALGLWIFGDAYVNPTTVALLVIGMMLVTGVITWPQMMQNKDAWNTYAWFATLVALADGLSRVGFIPWFATSVGAHLGGLSVFQALAALLLVNFLLHYLFASITAHVTAVLPVLLAVGAAIPGMPVDKMALLLCLQLGIMGVITPYGTGPSPVYFGSGFLPGPLYWKLGTVFGLLFLAAFFLITVPWVMLR
ncbi:MAG: DASS family sodium-coupled anion symporter [Geothrix sp.]|nr:DASS family sodium-coupled anion symporter [Geothrix sp.]